MQLIRRFWTEESVDFEGRYYRASGGLNQPKGIQQPHIPILVAGAGEQKTLRTVARWADASNIIDSPKVLRHKYDVLRKHCADVGRPYDDIRRTVDHVVHPGHLGRAKPGRESRPEPSSRSPAISPRTA